MEKKYPSKFFYGGSSSKAQVATGLTSKNTSEAGWARSAMHSSLVATSRCCLPGGLVKETQHLFADASSHSHRALAKPVETAGGSPAASYRWRQEIPSSEVKVAV